MQNTGSQLLGTPRPIFMVLRCIIQDGKVSQKDAVIGVFTKHDGSSLVTRNENTNTTKSTWSAPLDFSNFQVDTDSAPVIC